MSNPFYSAPTQSNLQQLSHQQHQHSHPHAAKTAAVTASEPEKAIIREHIREFMTCTKEINALEQSIVDVKKQISAKKKEQKQRHEVMTDIMHRYGANHLPAPDGHAVRMVTMPPKKVGFTKNIFQKRLHEFFPNDPQLADRVFEYVYNDRESITKDKIVLEEPDVDDEELVGGSG